MRRKMIISAALVCVAVLAFSVPVVAQNVSIFGTWGRDVIGWVDADNRTVKPVSVADPLPVTPGAGVVFDVDQGDKGTIAESWYVQITDGTNAFSASNPFPSQLYVRDTAGTGVFAPQVDGDNRLPITAHQGGGWTIDTSETCVPNLYDNPTVLAACDVGGTITASLDAGRYTFNVTGEATYFRLGVAVLATGGTLYVPGTQRTIQIAADATNIACRSPGAGGTIEVIPCL